MPVLHWIDHSAWGPQIEFLMCATDMGEARRLADEARAPRPTKQDRIERKDILYTLAVSKAGTLLWRPDSGLRGEEMPEPETWREGPAAARALRLEDASRYNEIQDAARGRRKHRE